MFDNINCIYYIMFKDCTLNCILILKTIHSFERVHSFGHIVTKSGFDEGSHKNPKILFDDSNMY